MTRDPAWLDAFCAAGCLLGLDDSALPPGASPPAWLQAYRAARDRQARAAALAPRLLALRIALDTTRLRWR